MKVAGVLLAGGQSRRFKSPKAFAVRRGKYFYEWTYQALEAVSEHIVIVAHNDLVNRFPTDRDVITDHQRYAGKGPLAGMYTAMQHIVADRYIVLPCDMPFMTADVCVRLVEAAVAKHCSVSAVSLMGQAHPLVSCWDRSMLAPLSAALAEDQFGVMKLFSQVHTCWLDGRLLTADAERVFCNVNWLNQWTDQG